jgi:peptidoglycan/LPS O-acetylase OafA/YrhL
MKKPARGGLLVHIGLLIDLAVTTQPKTGIACRYNPPANKVRGDNMREQLHPLTSMRFFAAFAVVLQHMQMGGGGSNAVEFFFTLSGFILAYGYGQAFAKPEYAAVRDFFVLRVARLYPVYLLTMLAAAALWIGSEWPYGKRDTLTSLFALQAMAPIGNKVYNFNGPSWSISVEFFFYALFPLIAWGIHRIGAAASLSKLAGLWLVLMLARVAIGYRYAGHVEAFSFGWWVVYISPYFRILSFAQGMLLGYAFVNCLSNRSRTGGASSSLRWTVLEVAAVAGFALWYLAQRYAPGSLNYGVFITPAVTVIILVFAYQAGLVSRLLSVKPLVHLGEISFSVYMVHEVVLSWAGRFLNPHLYGYSPHVWKIMAQVGIVLFILVLSDALFRYVEKPCRDLAKRYLSTKKGVYQARPSGMPITQ